MIPLPVLRLSFTFWKRTLDLSKRLSGPTWLALALINASIAISAFSLYRAEEVSESAIPPVYYLDRNLMPAPPPNDVPRFAHLAWDFPLAWKFSEVDTTSAEYFGIFVTDPLFIRGSEGPTGPQGLNGPLGQYQRVARLEDVRLLRATLSASTCKPFMAVFLSGHGVSRYAHLANANQFGGRADVSGFEWKPGQHLHLVKSTDRQWDFPKFLDQRDQVVLQISSSEAPSLLTRTQQIVAIL